MKTIKFLFLFSLSAIICSCAKDIVDLTGSISGNVKDATTGTPIQGCSVKLTPGNQSRITDSDGSFAFEEISEGVYNLSFSKDGYATTDQRAEVIPGKPNIIAVTLNRRAALDISPAELNFGEIETSKELYLKNTTTSTVNYTISANAEWISLSKKQGSISPGTGSDIIKIVISRNGLSTADYTKSISISFLDVNLTIPVYVTQIEKSTPRVSIGEVVNLKETSCSIGATLISTGGLKVNQYGHCYSEQENPTIMDAHTTLGDTESIESFESTITGLTKGKTYYIRAYAINNIGTTYSEQISITMPSYDVPDVTTLSATETTDSSTKLQGVVNNNSGLDITDAGFYYGETDNHMTKIKGILTGNSITATINKLNSNTKYYYKILTLICNTGK